jgi:NTP pyrophosphatase (non-canonical NTP hydrolase)
MDNKLNESLRETLLITQEECAEVTQAISKVLRFGTEKRWPDDYAPTNREKLEEEIGDLLAMIDILIEKAYLSDSFVNAARKNKKEKLKKWSSIFK